MWIVALMVNKQCNVTIYTVNFSFKNDVDKVKTK